MVRSLSLLSLLMAAGCEIEHGVFIDTREDTVVENFRVAGADTDIVFFADNSGSMQRELVTLGGSFERFLRRIDAANPNWQVIAITGDDGCSTSGVLTPETPDYLREFALAVQDAPSNESTDEWGLFTARQAVLKSSPGLCNEGFMRPEATLHVIFLSDEPDTSPGHELGGTYWQDYVTTITAVKGDPERVRFSAIVGPQVGGCQEAETGTGYIDAALATGGEVLSICDDWSDQIEILADASILQDIFVLEHEPLDQSVSVRVNSEERETGWEYVAEDNHILFTEDIPTGRDEVVVTYRALIEFEVEEDPNE